MSINVEEGQVGIFLTSLNRYGFKSEVYEGHYTYVIEDKAVRKRLQATGFFTTVELDPTEHVLLQKGTKTIAVKDPVTAVKLMALEEAATPRPPKAKTKKGKTTIKAKAKPREIEAGEADPVVAEEPLPDGVNDEGDDDDEGVEV